MEKAKQAVASFVSRDGKHKTTVEEDARKAVTEEHVRPHTHEDVTTAVDRDVHQDHHHYTVQPVTAKETLPEQHSHNLIPVEHKTFEHDNKEDLKATLGKEEAKFKDSSVTHNTTHSSSVAPAVTGERIHHHVHEHVQPVIQKETIQPQVVHTTVPVHETHHAETIHHGTSILPAESIESFNNGKAKGTLTGREATVVSEFEGCPKSYKSELQQQQLEADNNMHGHASDLSGTKSAGLAGVNSAERDQGNYTHRTIAGSGTGGTSNTESFYKTVPRAMAGTTGSRTATSMGRTEAKPSLMDKVNPTKDTDGDGKKGIMD